MGKSSTIYICSWAYYIYMVKYMEYSKIDKHGRVAIPSRIRKLVGVEGETEVQIRVEGRRIIIEPISKDVEARVREWVEEVLNMNIKPSQEEIEESWKWVSREYAEKKLGLLF